MYFRVIFYLKSTDLGIYCGFKVIYLCSDSFMYVLEMIYSYAPLSMSAFSRRSNL